MPDNNILFTYNYSLQKSEPEANVKINTQTVTQEPFFSGLSDGGDMKSLFQIFVSRECYHEFQNLTT